MSDHVYLRPADLDTLAELVLELAQQLHVERARRIALEQALTARGVLTSEAVEDIARSAPVRDLSRAALDQALERLMRILTAAGNPDAPLH